MNHYERLCQLLDYTRRLSDDECNELKALLKPEQLAIVEQAEKDCADLSLSYFDVDARSRQWMVGIGMEINRQTMFKYAVLQRLISEVIHRAGNLRGTKFSE